MSDMLQRLRAPFPASQIEWRIAQSGFKDGKPWAKVLAYVTNRAIMDRLDEVFGPLAWRNEFQRWGEHGVLCGIAVQIEMGQWVTKWDGAEETDIESTKGGLSSAMKRAAVQWGIGRYLYDLEEGWANIGAKGVYSARITDKKSDKSEWVRWSPPDLPAWALPKESLSEAPKALTVSEDPLPSDHDDDGVALTPLSQAEQLDLLKLMGSAKIKGKDGPPFYKEVTGRDWDGTIYQEDVSAIRSACAKRLTSKKGT